MSFDEYSETTGMSKIHVSQVVREMAEHDMRWKLLIIKECN